MTVASDDATATEPIPPPVAAPRRRERREPSFLGRLVVGSAALGIGLALVLENLDVLDITPKLMTGVLLAIVAIGLLVGAWVGRARWLILPGIVLSFVLIVTSTVPLNLKGGYGDFGWSPRTVEEIEPVYEHTAGRSTLDLSAVEFGRDADVDIDVRLGFGELYVVVPEDPDVVATAHVQGGEMSLFGRVSEGWDIDQRVVDEGGARRAATVTIDASVTFGEVHVLRGTPSDVPGLVTDRFGSNGPPFIFRDREERNR